MREKLVISLCLGVIFVLLVLRFVVLESIMFRGGTLQEIEDEVRMIKRENAFIRVAILEKSSLHYVQAEALKRGFQEVNPTANTYTLR